MQIYLLLTSLPLPLSTRSLTFGLPSFPGSKNRHTIHFLSPSTVIGQLYWWSEKDRARETGEREKREDKDIEREMEVVRVREERKTKQKYIGRKRDWGLFFIYLFWGKNVPVLKMTDCKWTRSYREMLVNLPKWMLPCENYTHEEVVWPYYWKHVMCIMQITEHMWKLCTCCRLQWRALLSL